MNCVRSHALDEIEAHLMIFPITPLDRHFVALVEVILDIARQEGRPCTAGDLLSRSGYATWYLEPVMQRLTLYGGYVLRRIDGVIHVRKTLKP
jgi:hypothetical protein